MEIDKAPFKPYYNSQVYEPSCTRGTFVGRLLNNYTKLNAIIASGLALVYTGCTGLGYQGGSIPTTFSGITVIRATSPETISRQWNAYPGATEYKIYTPEGSEAAYTHGFNNFLLKPNPINPSKTYQFSVTAVDPITALEQGARNQYASVQLLPHFNFEATGSVSTVSNSQIRVNWSGNTGVSYLIYVAERLPTGTIDYKGFISTAASAVGESTAIVSNLSEGREYCTVVVASYPDGTYDSPNGTLFTTDISTTLNTNAYLKGPSGSSSIASSPTIKNVFAQHLISMWQA